MKETMDKKESIAKESTVTSESRRDFIKGTATTAAALAGATLVGGTIKASSASAATASAATQSNPEGTTSLKTVVARPDLYFYPGEELASDEMRVTILGSGWGNIVRRAQAACSIFVELGNGDSFVFDMGQGTLINYNSLNIPYSRMAKMFFTHLHMDHMTDLAALYCFGPSGGDRFTPLEIWGPSGQKPELGINSVIEGLKQFTKWHTVSFNTCVPTERAYETETHELDYRKNPGIAYQKNGVTIKHWPALHIIDGAISYRLDWNGMSFVWSGDTNPNHFFVDNAKGADIIVHETAPIASRFAEACNVPQKIADNIIAASHTPAKAYGKVLSLTKPNLAVTNHCPIDPQEITEIVKDISVHWKGPYQIGQDFMVFNVSNSKKEILVRQAAVNERAWSPNVEKAKGKIPWNPADYRSKEIFDKEIKDY